MSAPIKKFVCGPVTVSVFKNETEFGAFHTCSISVRYLDGDTYKYNNSLKTDEVIIANKLLSMATDFMLEHDMLEKKTRSTSRQRVLKSPHQITIDAESLDPNIRQGLDDGTIIPLAARCIECNFQQFETRSGVTCKNGHGNAESVKF